MTEGEVNAQSLGRSRGTSCGSPRCPGGSRRNKDVLRSHSSSTVHGLPLPSLPMGRGEWVGLDVHAFNRREKKVEVHKYNYVCNYAHTCVHVCVHARTHIYIHVHTCTCMHVCMHV
jgi:hypothetical protein